MCLGVEKIYKPIQIPYILSKHFCEDLIYREEAIDELSDFVICRWDISSRTEKTMAVENIIVTDGCIDVIVVYDKKLIGFSGMSRTDFLFKIDLPCRSFGFRLKPGAFVQLLGVPALKAMDNFYYLAEFDENFDEDVFFSQPYEKAKKTVEDYLFGLKFGKEPDKFTNLFDNLSYDIPQTTKELYERLHFSPRQCQRLFLKHFGIAPQTVLSILRFQKCLETLTSLNAKPSDALSASSFYDQSHFIKDFKRNIGITPFELIRMYKS